MRKRKEEVKREEGDKIKFNNFILSFLLPLILLTISPAASYAQCKLKNTAMQAGEEINYDLYFYWGLVWKKAGTASFNIENTNYEATPAMKMNLLVETNRSADVFFRLRDTLTSVVSNDLEPLYFRKGAEEGKRYAVDEAKYTYKDGKSIVDQKRTRKDRDDVIHHYSDDVCVYDMLSILAKARSFNPEKYSKGDRIFFPMATGRRVDDIILEFRGKENVKAGDNNTYRCIVFALIEKNKKNKERDLITFYITDDKNHLPVQLNLSLNFGNAQVSMSSIKGQKHPIEAIVK